MTKYDTKAILQKLITEFPRPLNPRDFSITKDEEQEFFKLLLELKQQDLIDAGVLLSSRKGQRGLPVDIRNIKITKEGREFMQAEFV